MNNHGVMTWAQAPQDILQNQKINSAKHGETWNQLVGTFWECSEVRILTVGQVTWVKNEVSNGLRLQHVFQSTTNSLHCPMVSNQLQRVKVGIPQGLGFENRKRSSEDNTTPGPWLVNASNFSKAIMNPPYFHHRLYHPFLVKWCKLGEGEIILL